MVNDILVSVIIPVYNVEKYLRGCVESFLNQTYTNIQILLIDDGSTDMSGYLCDGLAKIDKRVEVIHKQNEGLGLTRNYGLKHAKGKYVLFTDSDDYVDISAIDKMVYSAEKEKAQLVIAGFSKVTEGKKLLYEERYSYEVFEGINVKNELLPRMIGSLPEYRDSIFTMACGKLYLTESIKKSNIYFPSERIIQSEDLAFQLDYIPHLNKVVVLEEIFYYYRQNSDSLTMKYKEDRFDEAIKVYEYVLEKIKEKKLPETALLRADKMLFVQLRGIFKQELPRYSKQSPKECLKKFEKILNNKVVIKAVCKYPIKLLPFKQQFFLYLIKYKCKRLLIIFFGAMNRGI